jgi:hypothetical protein
VLATQERAIGKGLGDFPSAGLFRLGWGHAAAWQAHSQTVLDRSGQCEDRTSALGMGWSPLSFETDLHGACIGNGATAT